MSGEWTQPGAVLASFTALTQVSQLAWDRSAAAQADTCEAITRLQLRVQALEQMLDEILTELRRLATAEAP